MDRRTFIPLLAFSPAAAWPVQQDVPIRHLLSYPARLDLENERGGDIARAVSDEQTLHDLLDRYPAQHESMHGPDTFAMLDSRFPAGRPVRFTEKIDFRRDTLAFLVHTLNSGCAATLHVNRAFTDGAVVKLETALRGGGASGLACPAMMGRTADLYAVRTDSRRLVII